MLKNFTYEISGIDNVNLVLPKNGNWYYNHLKNGNIKIHGRPTNIDAFSPTMFEQNIQNKGGNIHKETNLITKKEEKMSGPAKTPKDENTNNKGKTPIEELKIIEKEIETFLDNSGANTKAYENNWVTLTLTSNSIITGSDSFTAQLNSHLGTKITSSTKEKIKLLLEQIKKSLAPTKIVNAVYHPPTCKPKVATEAKTCTITISKSDCQLPTLVITTQMKIDDVEVQSNETYTIPANLFTSQNVLSALSEFTEGKKFLKGLTASEETFTPSN